MTDTSDSDLLKNGKDSLANLKETLAAGSKALLNNSPLEASENFKSVLHKMSSKSIQKMPVLQLVLRYALCIALIKCNDYEHIAEAVDGLLELIDSGYANKLPALYLALARAYYVLNRFKKSWEFIERGLKAVQTNTKVKQHLWPGLQQPIEETSKEFLLKELAILQKDCKKSQPPDAVCCFDKCLECSSHLIPARDIFFTDPDFKPFLCFICDASCKFSYHMSCWEHLKQDSLTLEEPKDLLGAACLVDSCCSKINNGSVVEVNLIGSEGFDKPLNTWLFQDHEHSSTKFGNCLKFDGLSNKTDVSSTSSNGSPVKANSKSSHPKENESYSEQPFLISSSLAGSYSSQDDIRSEPLDSSKLASLLEVLNQCRKIEFGYSSDEYMNPELQCFGRPYTEFSTYVVPDEIDKADKAEADFVFSYYYSMFEKNGLHRLEDLQETWKATISDVIGLPKTFTDKYSSVSQFLLKSERFAAIDDVIGTYALLPDMFSKAQVEITESVSFLLFSQVSIACIKDEHHSSDTFSNPSKTKINNNNCDSHTHLSPTPSSGDTDDYGSDNSLEDSDECERSNADLIVDKDSNDNPICCETESSIKFSKALEINCGFKPSSEVYIPRGANMSPKPEVVYMSDDDEEIESGNEVHPLLDKPVSPVSWGKVFSKPAAVDQDSQTEETIEKENLTEVKEILVKEVSELKYVKDELKRRIISLQLQMENNRRSQESHSKALMQAQEKLNDLLQKKTEELIKKQDQFCALEQELTQLKEQMKDKDNKVSDLDSMLQKVHRSHAKEMNNFVKRSQEEKLHKEEELKNLLMHKDQINIQLWKDFCEFKIKKFNQSCNDRINVLSQLRDMVSETIRPTKSDIKSAIEKYEEDMLAVAQKNAEVNDVFNQQMEKLRNGLEVQLPSVVDVPDTMNMHHPPEGAFEYLHSMIKPKQEEFAVARNHFSPAVSRFYPQRYPYNGLQPLSTPRENEGFPTGSNASLFSQGLHETSQLWNNSFAASTPAPSAMPSAFDVNNSANPHPNLHQGFSVSSPMMVSQPSLNLMPSRMPHQLPSSQNTSVPSVIGCTTSSPSLMFSTLNGTAFNSNTAVSNVLGSKALSSSGVQMPAAPLPTALKTLAPPSAAQGAIPKPRLQTATASMTPIVPSKPLARLVKSSRTNESKYEKLMRNLQKMFPTRNDMELTQALKMTREKNGNTLSSLSHSEIVSKMEETFNLHFRKQTSMGWEKFGQAAWGSTKAPVIEWDPQEQDECCICMAPMNAREVYTLECRHAFHKDCIRKWLEQDSVCPNCRTHSTMLDEFPPLG